MISCAHCGIEKIGVNRPLINWHTIITANIISILCSTVADLLAIISHSPDITSVKSTAARYIDSTLPTGIRP